MIRVYLLPVETIDGTERVAEIEFIHDAVLECTEQPDIRLLVMDTTQEEHDGLSAAALDWRDPTQDEVDRYNAQVVITPPDPDRIRAIELLATSPAVITMPEIWELLRIFGRFHGIPG